MSFPDVQYEVILADPPWFYENSQPNGWGQADKFYDLMSDEEIFDLDLQKILAPKAVVFLWATGPKLHVAIECLNQWGLRYIGVAFVWVKTRKDGQPMAASGIRPTVVKPLTEFVLVASNVRSGRPLPIADESIVQTVFAPRREHSTKPDEIQERIELLYPDASRIELFARRTRAGWDCWGDEAPVARGE